jgi:hypothetical protein
MNGAAEGNKKDSLVWPGQGNAGPNPELVEAKTFLSSKMDIDSAALPIRRSRARTGSSSSTSSLISAVLWLE